MAGRRTFFSFHYQRDIWRACIVRNTGIVDAQAAAGWSDASIWEEAKKKGAAEIKKLIDSGLKNTTVTVVLIGAQTSKREYVNYEISQSLERGNGLLGIHIHELLGTDRKADTKGEPPKLLADNKVPCYTWDRDKFGAWVEKAAVKAGFACLAHDKTSCEKCR
jgi:hypothetical protein